MDEFSKKKFLKEVKRIADEAENDALKWTPVEMIYFLINSIESRHYKPKQMVAIVLEEEEGCTPEFSIFCSGTEFRDKITLLNVALNSILNH